jgi:hypothetical protein
MPTALYAAAIGSANRSFCPWASRTEPLANRRVVGPNVAPRAGRTVGAARDRLSADLLGARPGWVRQWPPFLQGRAAVRCSDLDDHGIKRGWEAEPPPPLLEVCATPSHPSAILGHA